MPLGNLKEVGLGLCCILNINILTSITIYWPHFQETIREGKAQTLVQTT
jgi:hypothetical protein